MICEACKKPVPPDMETFTFDIEHCGDISVCEVCMYPLCQKLRPIDSPLSIVIKMGEEGPETEYSEMDDADDWWESATEETRKKALVFVKNKNKPTKLRKIRTASEPEDDMCIRLALKRHPKWRATEEYAQSLCDEYYNEVEEALDTAKHYRGLLRDAETLLHNIEKESENRRKRARVSTDERDSKKKKETDPQ
jgi:hypothetical protein